MKKNKRIGIGDWCPVAVAALTALTIAAGKCPSSITGSQCCIAIPASPETTIMFPHEAGVPKEERCVQITCDSERKKKECLPPNTSTKSCTQNADWVTKTYKQYEYLSSPEPHCGAQCLEVAGVTVPCPTTTVSEVDDPNCITNQSARCIMHLGNDGYFALGRYLHTQDAVRGPASL